MCVVEAGAGGVPERLNEHGQAVGPNIFAIGPACTVRVIPPPDEGRPESYSGAIGSNLAVKAALDATNCNLGDPLTLTLTVSGQVKRKNVSAETLPADQPARVLHDLRQHGPGGQKKLL